jgi:hypothetical protein
MTRWDREICASRGSVRVIHLAHCVMRCVPAPAHSPTLLNIQPRRLELRRQLICSPASAQGLDQRDTRLQPAGEYGERGFFGR